MQIQTIATIKNKNKNKMKKKKKRRSSILHDFDSKTLNIKNKI